MKIYRKFVLAGTLLALAVILANACVRLSGAEPACPAWPQCFDGSPPASSEQTAPAGYPAVAGQAQKVMAYRYLLAGFAGVLLLLNIFAWRTSPSFRPPALLATAGCLTLAGAHIFLNAQLAFHQGRPPVSMLHSLSIMPVFWLLYWLYLRLQPSTERRRETAYPRVLTFLAALALLLQLVSGLAVTVWDAGSACGALPACNGQWWPESGYGRLPTLLAGGERLDDAARAGLHWLHRLGGYGAAAVLLALLVRLFAGPFDRAAKTAGAVLAALLLSQAPFSFLALQMPVLPWVLAHHASAVLMLLPLIAVGFYGKFESLSRRPAKTAESGPVSAPDAATLERPPPKLATEPVEAAGEPAYVPAPPQSLLVRLKEQLKRTRSGLAGILAHLPIGEKVIDRDLLEGIETSLLTADVGIDTTQAVIGRLTEKMERHQLKDGPALSDALKQELLTILQPCSRPLAIPEQIKPFVILVVGVNGVGKTTTIGKLAKRLQSQGRSVMLAAGDTFRAAAVEQLQVWGARNEIQVVAQHTGADSASVIYDAVQSAQAKGVDVLIADTAGRLHTKSNLMDELKKVKRIIAKLDAAAPHEILLVLDAGTGQNALSQARIFNEAVELTGLVLTKLDGTAKGGVIFALARQFGIPIRYIGIGEGIDDLQDFNAGNFVDALFIKD